MTDEPHPPTRVLVAGGGVAALESVLALHTLAGRRVAIELLAPAGDFVHRPSSVLTPFGGEPAPRLELDHLRELDVHLHAGALASVDPERREVMTTGGGVLTYDRLIVAVGARSRDAVPGAVTFRGPLTAGAVEGALRQAARERGGRIVFAVPASSTWSLPLYELALLSARELSGFDELELHVVSAENRPLELFGSKASDAVARLLDRAGIDFQGGLSPEAVLDGALVVSGGRLLPADTVIAPPELVGPRIAGLPADERGFIEVDEHQRVVGCDDVYAAGDATAGPVKQGGLAAQQADAAAEAIAAGAGADLEPRPYRPILRGLLITGGQPLYLRTRLSGAAPVARELGNEPLVSRSALWWPPGKVAGRYLASFLATPEHRAG